MAASAVDIRLLGPVELSRDDGAVPLGGPRLRTILGLLALRAPDVVSRSALIDGVWDSTPPPNAATTLRAHVAYLRRGCANAGLPELIATRSPGYALTVPATCVDAHRFEAAVGEGRTASAAGAIEVMVVHLRTALQLWRGDVLADCATGEWARAEATRLREVRLYALEDLLGAELALGEHARVAAELEGLVARHPLRERLWELLMRALYRDGRQGEALGVYRRARTHLADELGVEPGPTLRRLEASILAGEDLHPDATGTRSRLEAAPGPSSHTIPAPLTNLVGRAEEVAELTALVTERRLVTLTGVGGCGKTRLAIAVSTQLADRYADGVRFLDLSPLTDPELVPATVAAAFGVPDDTAADPLDALAPHLRTRESLLVLDNCERLAGACARLVETVLRAAPHLRVLATSRHTLGVSGEMVWPVPPLAIPPSPAPADLAAVSGYSAVRLFLDRAAAGVVRGLADADAPALAAICAGLDGLPLGIELAAARTTVLTVAEIAERRYDPALLHDDRQREHPLDAAVGWSYALLDRDSQAKFRRLAVFADGFGLAAAEAIWQQPAVDGLTDLVGRSLVIMERGADGARFRLLETIRRWAADRLAERPDEQRAAQCRHAEYFLGFAEEADRQLRGPEVGTWLTRLGAEHENLRAAVAFTADDPATSVGLRLATALAWYCRLRGRYREGLRWLDDALRHHPEDQPQITGSAYAAAACLTFLLGDYADARVRARRALALHRRCADHAGTARMLRLLGCLARELGEYDRSLARFTEALEVPGADDACVADGQQLAGFTAWLGGDLDLAEDLLDDAFARYERLRDPESVMSTQTHLAAVALYRGHVDHAQRLVEPALDRFTELDEKEGIAWALNLLGLVAERQGRLGDAREALRASLDVHHSIGDRWRQASVLEALAGVRLAEGAAVSAAELAGLAGALRRTLGVPVPAVERPAFARLFEGLRLGLKPHDRRAALARGATMRVPEVVAALSTGS